MRDVTEGEARVLVSASRFLFSVRFPAGKGQTSLLYLSGNSVMLLAGMLLARAVTFFFSSASILYCCGASALKCLAFFSASLEETLLSVYHLYFC